MNDKQKNKVFQRIDALQPTLKERIKQLSKTRAQNAQIPNKRLKHLPGQHNQLDHAWNRGTGGGAEIDGNTYQGAIKLLDEQVANGEITQEMADLTRANLKKKFNERYDLISSLSLGMSHMPRRNRAENKLQKIRGNQLTDSAGIASAAQQGQLANRNAETITPPLLNNQMNVTETQPVADTQAKPSKYADKFSGLTDIQDIVSKAHDLLERRRDGTSEAPTTTEEFVDFLSYLPSYTMVSSIGEAAKKDTVILGMANLVTYLLPKIAQSIAENNEANDVPLDVITVGDSQFTTRPIRTWDELASIADKIKDNFKNSLDRKGFTDLGINVFSQNQSGSQQLFPNITRETPPRIINIHGLKIYTGPMPKNKSETTWLQLFYGDDVSIDTPELGNSKYKRIDPSLASEPEWASSVIPEAQLNEFRKKYNIQGSTSKLQQMLDNFTPEEKQTWDRLQEIAENRWIEFSGGPDSGLQEVYNRFKHENEAVERFAAELGEDNPIVQKMRDALNQKIIETYKIPTPPDYLSDKDKKEFQQSITDKLINGVKIEVNTIFDILGQVERLSQTAADVLSQAASAAYFGYVNKLRLQRGLTGPDTKRLGYRDVKDMVKADAVVPNPNPAATIDIDRQNDQPMTPGQSAQNIISIFDSIKTADGDAASEEAVAENARENFTRLTTVIQQLSPKEQMELIKNPEAMAMLQEAGLARSTMEALGIFGHPDTRLEIAQKAQGEMRENIDINTVDVLLADYLKKVQDGGNQEKLDEEYARQIMNIHTSNVNNVLRTAAVHQLFSQVGPNAGVPADRIRSFYVPGIVPPAPHPLAVEIMNRVYERQQAMFAKEGITEMPLYRGGALQGGLPQESWSSAAEKSEAFADNVPNAEFRAAMIPVKYMFVNYATFKKFSNYNDEEEHTILGASMYYDGETDVRTTGNVVTANTPRGNLLRVMPQYQPSAEAMQFAVDAPQIQPANEATQSGESESRIQNIIDRLKKLGAKYFPTKKERSLKTIKRTVARLSKKY